MRISETPHPVKNANHCCGRYFRTTVQAVAIGSRLIKFAAISSAQIEWIAANVCSSHLSCPNRTHAMSGDTKDALRAVTRRRQGMRSSERGIDSQIPRLSIGNQSRRVHTCGVSTTPDLTHYAWSIAAPCDGECIVGFDDAAAPISQPNPFLVIFTKPLFA